MSRPSEDTPPTNPDPSAGPLSDEAMARLRDEFRRRWGAGDRVRVEAFLAEQSGAPFNDEVVIELVYEEMEQREQLGEHPEVEEYLQRFPDQAESLRSLLSAHRLFTNHPELVEDFIAQHVSELVIQPLELINVSHDYRHTRSVTPGAFNFFHDAQFEKSTIENTGQTVQISELLNPVHIVGILNGRRANIGH